MGRLQTIQNSSHSVFEEFWAWYGSTPVAVIDCCFMVWTRMTQTTMIPGNYSLVVEKPSRRHFPDYDVAYVDLALLVAALRWW